MPVPFLAVTARDVVQIGEMSPMIAEPFTQGPEHGTAKQRRDCWAVGQLSPKSRYGLSARPGIPRMSDSAPGSAHEP